MRASPRERVSLRASRRISLAREGHLRGCEPAGAAVVAVQPGADGRPHRRAAASRPRGGAAEAWSRRGRGVAKAWLRENLHQADGTPRGAALGPTGGPPGPARPGPAPVSGELNLAAVISRQLSDAYLAGAAALRSALLAANTLPRARNAHLHAAVTVFRADDTFSHVCQLAIFFRRRARLVGASHPASSCVHPGRVPVRVPCLRPADNKK